MYQHAVSLTKILTNMQGQPGYLNYGKKHVETYVVSSGVSNLVEETGIFWIKNLIIKSFHVGLLNATAHTHYIQEELGSL